MIHSVLQIAAACWLLGLCSCSPSTTGQLTSSPPAFAGDEREAIEDLKARLWNAVRTKSAEQFLDCYLIEGRFDTHEFREANREQIEILLSGDIIDIEVAEIPQNELVQIMEIQNAQPVTAVRYSLVPRKMLWVRQEIENGTIGRGFLIGERDGKWHIITLGGFTT
jgi:hypothetical protein